MPVSSEYQALWSNHAFAVAAALVANDGVLVTALALVAAAWLHRSERYLLLPFVLGAIGAFAIDLAAGRLFFEVRPFAALHVTPLVPHDPLDNSFPSDHAALTAYVAAFLFFVDRRWALVALAAALLVGAARVVCLLHYPHDVFAGWAMGAIPACIAGFYGMRAAAARAKETA
jgi:membrane-associated phospholipid phosphatase